MTGQQSPEQTSTNSVAEAQPVAVATAEPVAANSAAPQAAGPESAPVPSSNSDSTPGSDAPVMFESHTPSETPVSAADVEEALRDVVDPELGINIVDLGLVYGVTVDHNSFAVIDMTLTSAACPLTDVIEDQTRESLEGLVSGYRVNWVWMPPWGPDKITEDGREMLRALGFNI